MVNKETIRVRQTRIINKPGSAADGLRMRVEDKRVPIVLPSGHAGAALEIENPLAKTLKEINKQLSRRTPRVIPYHPPRR